MAGSMAGSVAEDRNREEAPRALLRGHALKAPKLRPRPIISDRRLSSHVATTYSGCVTVGASEDFVSDAAGALGSGSLSPAAGAN